MNLAWVGQRWCRGRVPSGGMAHVRVRGEGDVRDKENNVVEQG